MLNEAALVIDSHDSRAITKALTRTAAGSMLESLPGPESKRHAERMS